MNHRDCHNIELINKALRNIGRLFNVDREAELAHTYLLLTSCGLRDETEPYGDHHVCSLLEYTSNSDLPNEHIEKYDASLVNVHNRVSTTTGILTIKIPYDIDVFNKILRSAFILATINKVPLIHIDSVVNVIVDDEVNNKATKKVTQVVLLYKDMVINKNASYDLQDLILDLSSRFEYPGLQNIENFKLDRSASDNYMFVLALVDFYIKLGSLVSARNPPGTFRLYGIKNSPADNDDGQNVSYIELSYALTEDLLYILSQGIEIGLAFNEWVLNNQKKAEKLILLSKLVE